MMPVIYYDIQTYVDMREMGHNPHLNACNDEKLKVVENLSVAILDSFGKSYLFTLAEENMSVKDRLWQILSRHKSKKKLIVISHADWIFNDDSIEAIERLEEFIHSQRSENC